MHISSWFCFFPTDKRQKETFLRDTCLTGRSLPSSLHISLSTGIDRLSSSSIVDPSVSLVDLLLSLFSSLETGGVRFEGLWRCRRWGHGLTVDTEAFERAVVEISKHGGSSGGQLNVPPGRWLTAPFNLTSHMTLFLAEDSEILGVD
ncbi:hypothetical protein YC2023_012713 [Brassica napus]